MSAPEYTAKELGARFGLEVAGDPNAIVRGVATLANAKADTLGFLANPKYRAQLAHPQARVVTMRADDAEGFQGTALIARDPYAAFARIAALFEPRSEAAPGIHASAVVDPTAKIDATAHVGPFVVIGARCTVG